ncbi:hypothetical protein ACF06X_21075 [Streptomyces sp. NPDC015346]|uniref:hypothetical protein n=1 Tax=Streptomyces sp. NPDC015346 TaxID=3364954 RepID=UPI0036F82558
MAERTTHLNLDPRTRDSRKIHVRAARWYATVELNRDKYVDAATSLGHDPELPTAFLEAVDRVRDACTDRIWYDGYPGSFSWGGGSRWVTLFVQFPYVDAAVEALRAAESIATTANSTRSPNDWPCPWMTGLLRASES